MYIIRWGEMVVTASAAGELSVEIRHTNTNPGIQQLDAAFDLNPKRGLAAEQSCDAARRGLLRRDVSPYRGASHRQRRHVHPLRVHPHPAGPARAQLSLDIYHTKTAASSRGCLQHARLTREDPRA
jgi:hypothetical protein